MAASSVSGHTILYVEDDAGIRQVFAEVLREEGYTVHEAADGVEAIAALDVAAPGTYCLLLLDMMLPRVAGDGVLAHVQRQGGVLPVVAMSASTDHLRLARANGALATLAKPVELDELLQVVAIHC